MKIITIGALKGGVGKTNFTFNLAGVLSKQNKKVLLIDLDPQGNLTNNFGLLNNLVQSKAKKLFNNDINLLDDNLIEKWKYENYEIDIISNNIEMTTLETEIINRNSRETILKRTFIKNINILNTYDYVLFDTNPSINIINKNAYAIADEIIIISDNSVNSLLGINILDNIWQLFCNETEIQNNMNAIVLNNFDNFKVSKDFLEYLNSSSFQKKILENRIKGSQVFKKSEINKLPLAFYSQTIHQKEYYENIYNELYNKNIL